MLMLMVMLVPVMLVLLLLFLVLKLLRNYAKCKIKKTHLLHERVSIFIHSLRTFKCRLRYLFAFVATMWNSMIKMMMTMTMLMLMPMIEIRKEKPYNCFCSIAYI